MRLGVLGLVLATATGLPLSAAPPKVTHLFPSGAKRGSSVEVQIVGTVETWPPGIHIGGTGLEVSPRPEKGKLAVRVDPDAAPGLRWIRIFTAEGTAAPRPFVVGTIDEILEIEPNDSPAQANEIKLAQATINGRLGKSGDVDAFAVPLTKGQTLVASLDAFRRLKSPMDAVLQIVSEQGFVLAQDDDDSGFDPLLAYTATADGRFIVRTFAFPAQPDSTIGFAGGEAYVYRLTLTTGPFADYLFPLTAELGRGAECIPVGWNISAGPAMAIVGPFASAGRIDVQSGAFPCPAIFHATPFPVILETGLTTRSEPQEIPFPSAVSGRIDSSGDVDVFRVHAPKGQKLRLSVESRALGRPLDPVLRLFDKSGKKLAESDDASNENRDAEIVQAMPDEGELLIEIEDLHHRGGWRYAYALLVSAPEPDFSLYLGSEGLAVVIDKPTEVVVTVERRHDFNREIEIGALDLPPGVEVDAVKSAPQGDSSKSVKLVLKALADARPWSCPIRITGRTPGDSPVERAAEAWLTVLLAPVAPAK